MTIRDPFRFDLCVLGGRPDRSRARAGLKAGLMAVVVGVALAVAGSPAVAQSSFACTAPVVDTSGLLDVAAVEDAIERLDLTPVGPGAAVIVRTWDRVPDGDLTAAVDDLVVECFGDPDGGIERGIAVLAVSTEDRLVDVLIGSGWVGIVDENRLGRELMTPRLAEGDLDGALLDALSDIAAATEASGQADADPSATSSTTRPAPSATTSADDQVDAEPSVPVGAATSEPGDLADRSPLVVALGVLGLGGCAGAVVLVTRRRSLDQDRRRLARLVEPVQGRLRILRDRHDRLMAEAGGWERTTAGRSRTAVLTAVRQAEAGRDATDRAAGLLHRTLPHGAGRADRRELERAREHVKELSLMLAANDDALDELAALGAHLDHLRVALPVKAELLAREVPDVRSATNRRASEGWEVEAARAGLTRIDATVEEVRAAASLLEVDLLDLSDRLEQAEAELFATDHDIETLPEREASLNTWNDQLGRSAEHELVRVDELRRQLAAAARLHAPESWRSVVHHAERVVEVLDEVEDLRDEVTHEHLPGQDYDEAGRLLEEAGLELMVADELLDEADDLLVDLDRARAEAPGAVAESRGALRDLSTAIAQFGSDVDQAIVRRHQELTALVAALDQELGRPKPHHIRVVETAEQLGEEIDGLLDTAEAQHLAAEALRRQLDREISRASRALSRARRSLGWQLLPSGDGATIERLEAELRALPADLPAAVEAAADIADAALRIQEQIIARRRRRAMAVSAGSSPSIGGGHGWTIGGSGSSRRSPGSSSRGSGSATRSRGGRSFGGRTRSSGGRSLGSRRSSGRF